MRPVATPGTPRRPPPSIRAWMEDPGSVTSRMRRVCRDGFSLILIGQRIARPFPPESRMLGLRPGRSALVRQVLLCCAGEPWVYARSVLPVPAPRGRIRRLVRLGSRPLGEVLFALPGLVRREVGVAPLSADRLMRAACADAVGGDPAGAWLRRSVFFLDNYPLLVNEVFLSRIPHE